jgi:glycosyltransferase involved in cell wall biosynthesis
VYALPARYEPFGLTALEAALSGCALVLGDIASLREIWADAALFVDPSDDGALESGIRTLIENPDLRRRYADRAAARARLFSTEQMGSEYLQIYRAALETRRLACAS